MKLSLLFIISMLFVACGSGGNSTNTNTNKVDDKKNTQDEPYWNTQWSINYNKEFYDENTINNNAHINGLNTLSKYSGKGIKIAIIDDGLDISHEDLPVKIKTYDGQTQGSDVSHTTNADNHGTAVTGIIAAQKNNIGIQGIAYNAEIMFIKYSKNGSQAETIRLFKQAEDWDADIINCSWGTDNVSPIVENAIKDLATNGRNGKGTIIVFATGNKGKNIFTSSSQKDESSISEVLSVGATNKYNTRAYYSNYGDNIDLLAPGGQYLGVSTLDPMNSEGKSIQNLNYLLSNNSNAFIGTSSSAPIVSGVVALLLEKNPNLTRIQIESILQNSADKIGSTPYVSGFNIFNGYGKINVDNAIVSF